MSCVGCKLLSVALRIPLVQLQPTLTGSDHLSCANGFRGFSLDLLARLARRNGNSRVALRKLFVESEPAFATGKHVPGSDRFGQLGLDLSTGCPDCRRSVRIALRVRVVELQTGDAVS